MAQGLDSKPIKFPKQAHRIFVAQSSEPNGVQTPKLVRVIGLSPNAATTLQNPNTHWQNYCHGPLATISMLWLQNETACQQNSIQYQYSIVLVSIVQRYSTVQKNKTL